MSKWPNAQLRQIARLAYGDSLAAENRRDGEIPVYGSNGPVGFHSIANTGGPVIVVGRKGSHGTVQFSDKPVFAIDTTYFVDSSTTRHDLRWLYYALVTARLNALTNDVGVPGLNRDAAHSVRISLPPFREQRAIADYLDAETSRIDALIAKKRRMIELLHEGFAVATRNTIDGDEGSEMPDMFAGSAGNVHSEWQTHKLSRVARIGSGTTPNSGDPRYYSDDVEAGTPWVTTAELRESSIFSTRQHVTREAIADYSALRIHPPGAVLIAMYGATVGRLGRLGVAATVNQACCSIECRDGFSNDFVYWWLWTHRQELIDISYGAGQPNISQEIIRSLRFAAPEFKSQQRIADAIADRHRVLMQTVSTLESQLLLLTEHRQALITAAVTGEFEIPTTKVAVAA